MTASIATSQTILVVGGGISGMTAALEAAECGKQVILVERNRRRSAAAPRCSTATFPKMCHPTCGLEINLRRLKANRNVRVLTHGRSHRDDRHGAATTRVTVQDPRRATSTSNCTACGDCAEAVERRDPQSVQLRPRPDQGGVPAARDGVSAALRARSVDHRHARRREGEGRLQVRRDRSRRCARRRSSSRSARSSGRPAGSPTTRRRSSPTATAASPTSITSVEFERLADPHGPTGGKLAAPVRRQGGEEHRVHPVRRLARREPPAPLLAHLLHGVAEADAVRARGVRRRGASRRSTTSTSARSTASRISTRRCSSDPTVKFVKSKVARIAQDEQDRRPDPARRRHRGLPPLRERARSRRAGDRHGAGDATASRHARRTSIADSSGFIEGVGRRRACSAPAARPIALDVNRAVQSATAAALRAIQVVHKAAGAEA